MNSGSGSGCSGDEQESTSSAGKGKKSYHRHNSHQIQQLEAFFKECPHPDENQRRQLSRDLGLEPKQIKFWFQNKRTQTKAQSERADNSTLRAENERIYSENLAIKEALKNYEKVSNLLTRYIGRPISQIESLMPVRGSSLDCPSATFSNQGVGNPSSDLNVAPAKTSALPLYQAKGIPEMEKALMVETAAGALDELTKLLRLNEPLWTKSSADGRYLLLRDSYDKIFPRSNHFKSSSARFESSKDSVLVAMNSVNLVDTFLDADKWADMFPTIITQARTIQVIEPGISGSRSGSLQLMYEQLHVLSPLVPPREFYFLRYCQQIEVGLWVIADVSYESVSQSILPSRSWRLPSGCMIQDMPHGCSKVTWVEHVEVDDKTQTHRLYRDIVCSGLAYGAERWVAALQRTCERLTYSMGDDAVARDLGGVISLCEGRRSIMKLAWRMVKNFCATLSMSGKLDFPQLSEVNNSGVRISIRKSTSLGEPGGTIVGAATSLWLPVPPQRLFNFFRDEKMRVQWDVLANGNPVHEVAHISNGPHPGNSISIIRPYIPTENMLMLQESCIDHLGSLIVSAPVDVPSINEAVSGGDSSIIPILPSGFIICGDSRPGPGSDTKGGCLLTVAFQVLVAAPSSENHLNLDSIATINTLISSTVQRIKAALNSSRLD
ncbi:hypothetical protein CDL15_Pgr020328 [Punica granatum]|uniref:Homeobox-leucine zipper protein ROC8-like n=1 Tax=Punica granatum TaxID=22663 RepID=A0A218VWV8_PUNGR|nr:hypothetical protein CDL15_Pgr020328 [Punica granatum]